MYNVLKAAFIQSIYGNTQRNRRNTANQLVCLVWMDEVLISLVLRTPTTTNNNNNDTNNDKTHDDTND